MITIDVQCSYACQLESCYDNDAFDFQKLCVRFGFFQKRVASEDKGEDSDEDANNDDGDVRIYIYIMLFLVVP